MTPELKVQGVVTDASFLGGCLDVQPQSPPNRQVCRDTVMFWGWLFGQVCRDTVMFWGWLFGQVCRDTVMFGGAVWIVMQGYCYVFGVAIWTGM